MVIIEDKGGVSIINDSSTSSNRTRLAQLGRLAQLQLC